MLVLKRRSNATLVQQTDENTNKVLSIFFFLKIEFKIASKTAQFLKV